MAVLPDQSDRVTGKDRDDYSTAWVMNYISLVGVSTLLNSIYSDVEKTSVKNFLTLDQFV